uniref:Wsv416 n=1 Tax=White spot syndrome virus TaxID=92652 RepID=A0A2U9GDB3_WSSV|nr:wsv416 [Shrimp white spot syndrome virus]
MKSKSSSFDLMHPHSTIKSHNSLSVKRRANSVLFSRHVGKSTATGSSLPTKDNFFIIFRRCASLSSILPPFPPPSSFSSPSSSPSPLFSIPLLSIHGPNFLNLSENNSHSFVTCILFVCKIDTTISTYTFLGPRTDQVLKRYKKVPSFYEKVVLRL